MNTILKKYWGLIVVISIYIILAIFYFNNFQNGISISNEDWGTFGDFFGGTLSPIIGIISIYLTYNIIYNQIKENKQSEFKYIFQILFDSLDTKRNSITWNQNNKSFTEIKAIQRINSDIESLYSYLKDKNKTKTDIENFQDAFWSIYEDINGSSSPYMKVIHNSLKSIDKNCLDERKEEYSSILRAQLNSDELIFIFYNSISTSNFKNFKNRIEKFSILKDVSEYKFPEELKVLMGKKAFDEQSSLSIINRELKLKLLKYEITLNVAKK